MIHKVIFLWLAQCCWSRVGIWAVGHSFSNTARVSHEPCCGLSVRHAEDPSLWDPYFGKPMPFAEPTTTNAYSPGPVIWVMRRDIETTALFIYKSLCNMFPTIFKVVCAFLSQLCLSPTSAPHSSAPPSVQLFQFSVEWSRQEPKNAWSAYAPHPRPGLHNFPKRAQGMGLIDGGTLTQCTIYLTYPKAWHIILFNKLSKGNIGTSFRY